MNIVCFLDPETVNPFAEIVRDKMPEIGEMVEIKGKQYQTFKRVHFANEKFPFIAIKRTMERPCDEDCNHCPVIIHQNSRMLTKVLNELHDKFGVEAYAIVQRNCPNMTVCADCSIDDFTHFEGCELIPQKETIP